MKLASFNTGLKPPALMFRALGPQGEAGTTSQPSGNGVEERIK
jgi:hypothetical protein